MKHFFGQFNMFTCFLSGVLNVRTRLLKRVLNFKSSFEKHLSSVTATFGLCLFKN